MPEQTHAELAGRFAEHYLIPLERLIPRQTMKWQFYPNNVLPAWVAEMDYALAPSIGEVFKYWARAQEAGYPYRQHDRAEFALARAFSRYTRQAFHWDTDPDNVLTVNELVQAIYVLILAFSEPGDGIVFLTPSYPPFANAVRETGRRPLTSALVDNGAGYAIDFAHLEQQAENGARILLLCNPHNPTGRVFRRDELEKLAALAEKHDLLVIADEIHADLVYPDQRHIPFGSLRPSLAARTVTLNSASKSFNIPGLRCGVIYFGAAALKARFTRRLPARTLGYPAGIGIDATVAAWDEGGEWLEGARHYLFDRREQTYDTLQEYLPQARLYAPEATYFAWIDLSSLRLSPSAGRWYLQHAGLALSAGETFIEGGEPYVRLNFATSQDVLRRILDRLILPSRR
ncbi:aminotransferase class I/II-fold pyridoxal phosphate-dependent enzyme [Acerihabitans sp. KWT182]|uniref:cysteine-S-conjugate beta-lyase n=1 Tax=Acerihabitans sp. KWT182 TaxID=3157919 RepID=A0AAU7Q971_9GAMM